MAAPLRQFRFWKTGEEAWMRIHRELIYAAAGTALLLASAVWPVAAQTTPIFRNEKVVVTKLILAPGAEAPLHQAHPSVVVFLQGQSVEKVLPGGSKQQESIERGKAQEEPAGAEILKNTGSTPLVFARVEFLTGGGNGMWGASGLAPNYKVLFEDRYSRTYEIRVPAHGSEPEHSHHDRVVVCLSGAQLMHTLPDGSTQHLTLKAGEIGWRVAQTHKGENLGDTDLWVIAIEPK
jgi:quercetin dioxygenase-like cupin family protein